MKVLQINAVYGFGSTGIIVKDIGDMLENNNHVCYYAFHKCNVFPKNGYKIGNRFDEKIHAFYTRIFGKQGYASVNQTKKFLKWVDKIEPDIVHLHNIHSNYINFKILLRYLAKKNIATVITLHDCWFFTGKCTHYIESNCYRWKDQCGCCPQKNYPVKSFFFDKSSDVLFDKKKYINSIPRLKIFGCSKWICNECKQSILKNCDIDFIYNGIDTSIFQPTEQYFRNFNNLINKFVILGFSNKWCMDANKKAVEKIIESLTDDDVIVLVGCSNQVKKRFVSNKNVICLGFINDRKQLADIYSSCDVFVNLTHADTLPTVNMESISCGTPVITYDVCGSPELVNNNGYIIKENDIDSLIKIIFDFKNKSLKENLKVKKDLFDKNKMYLAYLENYAKLIEN